MQPISNIIWVMMLNNLKLDNLPQRSIKILRPSSSTRPTIWLVEENGVKLVVKDFSRNRCLYKNLFGRLLIWREAKAYRRLRGLKGIPRCYGVLEGLALVTEFVEGKTLKQMEKEGNLSPLFFERLKELIDSFHMRGIAHCDLKRTPNILVSRGEQPYILDWAASIFASECKIFPLTKIYKRLLRDDDMALIKMKLRHIPQHVTKHEKAMYERRSPAERLIRSIRDKLREWLQRLA